MKGIKEERWWRKIRKNENVKILPRLRWPMIGAGYVVATVAIKHLVL